MFEFGDNVRVGKGLTLPFLLLFVGTCWFVGNFCVVAGCIGTEFNLLFPKTAGCYKFVMVR